MPPLASIVIDNYNYGRFLRDAIDSALGQTYTPLEVIVVDDGSSDDSREVIASYGSAVRAIFKPNGGQGSAFNAGFAASRGDIVLFLDADDVYRPEAVASAVPFFEDPELVKVQWPLELGDERARPTGRLYPAATLPDGDLREEVFRVGPTNHLSAPGTGTAWARWFLERVLPLPEALYRNGCDTCLFELAPFFGRIKSLGVPLGIYRQHGANDHVSMPAEAKVERELRFYEHYTAILREHFERAGRQPDYEAWRRHSWWHRQAEALRELAALPDPHRPLILADEGTWELGPVAGRERRPFPEAGGEYAGPPLDDRHAIEEAVRQREAGARFLAFAWPAFWWLDHYAGLRAWLERFACAIRNDRLVVFDLDRPAAAGGGAAWPEAR
jgi:hypothetical protein